MEIAFLWTDKFKVLKDFSYNFCSSLNIRLENNDLIIEEINRDVDPLFQFYGKGISSLKVIVGENGCGKSTVMELIKILCCTSEKDIKRRSPDNFNAFLLLRKSEGQYAYFSQGTVPFVSSLKNIQRLKHHENSRLSGIEFVFYSSLFEYGEKLKNKYEGLFDISTIGEVKSAFYSVENDFNSELTYEFLADTFYNSEINNQVELIFSKSINIPFSLPDKLNLNIVQLESSYEHYEKEEGELKQRGTKLKGIEKFISEFDYENQLAKIYDVKESFRFQLLKTAISSYIKEKSVYLDDRVSTASYKVNDDIIYQVITSIRAKSIEDRFIEFFNGFEEHSDQYIYNGKQLLNSLNRIADFLGRNGTILNDKSAFYVSKGNDSAQAFKQLLQEFFDQRFFPNLINFKWNNLSSGEIQFINILSRINAIKRIEDSPNTVFMIDEGEVTLHPEWQRQYIKFIVENLPKLFPGTDFQLILSTHSPIILSDILDRDIKYLKEENNKMKTFGANIYELYATSFSMAHVMGDYAKKKIENLLGELFRLKENSDKNQTKISSNKYLKLKDRIEIIGDEVIRKRMLEILDSIPSEYMDLEHELDLAKRRVLDLEKRIANEKI